jgi:formylmethanofuran dehydrogenase subunit D
MGDHRKLQKGSFIFRANKNNEIVFGHNATSETGVPNYNGSKIEINAAGNYTITFIVVSR